MRSGCNVQLIEGTGGVFDIVVDDQLKFSKKISGNFPSEKGISSIMSGLKNHMLVKKWILEQLGSEQITVEKIRYIDIFEEELEYELYDVSDTLRK